MSVTNGIERCEEAQESSSKLLEEEEDNEESDESNVKLDVDRVHYKSKSVENLQYDSELSEFKRNKSDTKLNERHAR